ncbi:unnamed protein product [Discosporangium mesarthrocarpum]
MRPAVKDRSSALLHCEHRGARKKEARQTPQTQYINQGHTPRNPSNIVLKGVMNGELNLEHVEEYNWLEGPGYGSRGSEGGSSTSSSRGESPPPGTTSPGDEPGRGVGGRDRARGHDSLKILNVCDKETGVCLFQQHWQWKESQEPASIGKLVRSFYQFAREVNGGDISCVNFTGQPRPNRRASRRARSTSAMQMVCSQNDDIIVAVFHEIKTSVITSTDNLPFIRDFVRQVKDSFCGKYPGRVTALRPMLRQCADGDANGEALLNLQQQFEAFKDSVEHFRNVCFPP